MEHQCVELVARAVLRSMVKRQSIALPDLSFVVDQPVVNYRRALIGHHVMKRQIALSLRRTTCRV